MGLSTARPEDAERIRRMRWWTLAVLSLSLVIIAIDNTILNVAIPTLQRELDASASLLQWIVDAYILVFAGLLLTMGALGDRFGRAKALRIGLVIFGAAALTAVFASSAGQLVAIRAVMGIGGALIMPSTLSILSDVFRGPERARAIATWAGVSGLGISLGPVLGGALLDHFSWGSVFLVNVPVAAIALLAGWKLVPESRDPVRKPLDVPGAALSAGAVALLVYAIIEAPREGWDSGLVVAGFLGAAALGAAFLVRLRMAGHPLVEPALFGRRAFSSGAGAIALAFFALLGMVFGFQQFLQFVKGYSPLEAGAAILPVGAGVALGSRISQRMVVRVGAKPVVTAAFLVLAGAMTAVSWYEPSTPYWVMGLVMFFSAGAMGSIMAPSTNLVMGSVPVAQAGVGSAMNDVARQVGAALGVAVIGSILNDIYASKMSDFLAASGSVSASADAAIQDNIGSALHAAASLPPESQNSLVSAARHAFTDGFGIAVLAAAGIAVAGALFTVRWMPVRPQEFQPPGSAVARERTAQAPVPASSADTPR